MADPHHVAILKQGVEAWNRWRREGGDALVDLSGADLARAKLNGANLLRANLKGAKLSKAQLENTHLKDADLTAATLDGANFEHANARGALFDGVAATGANFEVATLRGAHFRGAALAGARFHRAYLREADLSGADLKGAWLRFATLDDASCKRTDFTGADLRYASLVETDLCGATLVDVHVYGVSAWKIATDAETRQDLIVGRHAADAAPLRAPDLHTAQLLALMLDGEGVRQVFDAVSSKLVLLLGSFAPAEKPALDALREGLIKLGYVAVVFDFVRPGARDYAETVVVLGGLSRFVVADFTNAKEVRAEVVQLRSQYARVPILPIVRKGEALPVTMVNVFAADELANLLRYESVQDLVQRLEKDIVAPAEARAKQIAERLAQAERILRGDETAPAPTPKTA